MQASQQAKATKKKQLNSTSVSDEMIERQSVLSRIIRSLKSLLQDSQPITSFAYVLARFLKSNDSCTEEEINAFESIVEEETENKAPPLREQSIKTQASQRATIEWKPKESPQTQMAAILAVLNPDIYSNKSLWEFVYRYNLDKKIESVCYETLEHSTPIEAQRGVFYLNPQDLSYWAHKKLSRKEFVLFKIAKSYAEWSNHYSDAEPSLEPDENFGQFYNFDGTLILDAIHEFETSEASEADKKTFREICLPLITIIELPLQEDASTSFYSKNDLLTAVKNFLKNFSTCLLDKDLPVDLLNDYKMWALIFTKANPSDLLNETFFERLLHCFKYSNDDDGEVKSINFDRIEENYATPEIKKTIQSIKESLKPTMTEISSNRDMFFSNSPDTTQTLVGASKIKRS